MSGSEHTSGKEQPMGEEQALKITSLLKRWNEGDAEAASEVLPLFYDELHRIAARYERRERPGHTLQATAIVHEAYVRLIEQPGVEWRNRHHFLGLAAHVMRRVLVDYARAHNSAKRGGKAHKLTLAEAADVSSEKPPDLVALDEALEGLDRVDPELTQLVELRYFAGLTIPETAEFLDISPITVKRRWRRARAWLYQELSQHER